MKNIVKSLFVCSLILIVSNSLFAGNTGKIIGRITDAISGEPLVGVNVLVVGTQRGGITDMDGKYSIIGVPIGSYSVRASQVGYASVEIKDVKVGADETTPLNFKLTSSEVQLTGVTITADQQLVNSLTTSSTQTVSDKSIQSIPNVKSVEDVLKLQAGFVKQGKNLFLRGGRANEVQYLVDGVPTNNVVENSDVGTGSANSELQQLYAGVQSGVTGGSGGLSVSANAIQSISVQTSGFDADYGNAQSGIINITTKSGGDRYTGSLQYRTDRFGGENQNEAYSAFSIGGPEPLTKYLLPTLGFKIPGNLTIFMNTDMTRSDGWYKYAHNEFYIPIERKIELNGFLGGILNASGFHYRDNQDNSFTFNTKLKYDISGDDQISYAYYASLSSSHPYNADPINVRPWKYRADSSAVGVDIAIQNTLSWQHFFSPKTLFKFYIAKSENRNGNDVAGIKPPDYSTANADYYDVNGDGFNELGTYQRWYNSHTTIWSSRFDFNSQVHPLHLLKTGMEIYFEQLNSTNISYPTYVHSVNGVDVPPPDPRPDWGHGDYPGYGLFRYHLYNFPTRGALFLQDNIELAGLNLHVGLRYDYLDLGAQVYDSSYIASWISAYKWVDTLDATKKGQTAPDWVWNMPGKNRDEKQANGKKDMKRFWYYFTHGYFSPRLSIGYPVTDRIVFYFNYGHFIQFPDRTRYFRDIFAASSGATVGNPDLKPQRTVAYEAGFEDQFSDDMAFTIHAYYKDIFDYPTLIKRGDYNFYKNFDYASSRGFDLSLNQALAGNFSVSLSYSYLIAKGRAATDANVLLNPQLTQLAREIRMPWDQTHTANLFATYRVGPKEEGHFFGLPFVNNYGISVTWSFNSGSPYSGYLKKNYSQVQYNSKINSESGPYNTTLNLSVYKGVRVFDAINMMLTLDIINLLNRKNADAGSINNYTGRVTQYGDFSNNDEKIIRNWNVSEFYALDRTLFQPPRQILFGVRLNWD
jgi:outer membrane receptor protein involved in Fe transport